MMDKQAYEHIVGLALRDKDGLSKQAGAGAFITGGGRLFSRLLRRGGRTLMDVATRPGLRIPGKLYNIGEGLTRGGNSVNKFIRGKGFANFARGAENLSDDVTNWFRRIMGFQPKFTKMKARNILTPEQAFVSEEARRVAAGILSPKEVARIQRYGDIGRLFNHYARHANKYNTGLGFTGGLLLNKSSDD